MLAIIDAAGWPIWPLILASVLALAIIIERFYSLRVSEVCPPTLLGNVVKELQGHGVSSDMLTKLANVAVIALENARLFAQAERVATLEERRRVAAEMHDGLGQTLSYLGLMTDQVVEFLSDGQETSALQRLHKTRETISKATSDVRRAINMLMDDTPVTKDLNTRLRDTLDEIASLHDLESAWRSDADSQMVDVAHCQSDFPARLHICVTQNGNILATVSCRKISRHRIVNPAFFPKMNATVNQKWLHVRGHFGLHYFRAKTAMPLTTIV